MNLPDPEAPLIPRWEGTVHQRFSEQACRVPERMAVVDAGEIWSYDELERCSNRLAGHLRAKGIQRGDAVAICSHRSTGLVLSVLGVLKVGAAFVILDSRYPVSRLMKMLEEASPRGWIQMEAAGPCADEVRAWLDASQLTCRLTIPGTKKATEDLLKGMSPEPPEDGVGPDDMAYITFTSGTTGRPKGIVGTHRPLAHFLEWHCREFDLKGSDRFSMLSGLSHDPLLRDIFAPLWLGATLCTPDPDEMLIPDKLRAWMRTQHITVAHITPALGQLLSHAAEAKAGDEELPALRYVFFGGDILTQRHVDKIRGIAPSVTCVNYYGATETPQAMGYHVVDAQQENELRDRVPVGKGIEGVQLLVLNPVGQVAGIGELGEIHIRTPYLARCYLKDEELTRDRFIPNPFVDLSGDRLYRTGDLGRYLPDGQVMFHGRSDGQVSIRGFRVELKEIEAILTTHPDIGDCVVIARERESDEKYLAAYVVSKGAQTLDPANLRQHVGKHLPEYMIPSVVIALEELPLTLNGKIDTAGLIRLEPPKPGAFSDESLTKMEEILINIWKEVLGFNSITVHNNFFEIGGHSLLSIQVIARLEKKIGLKVNPREFVYQTLGQLAASIERQRKGPTPGGGESKRKSIWRTIKQKISLKTNGGELGSRHPR